jgi:hypothetical protein
MIVLTLQNTDKIINYDDIKNLTVLEFVEYIKENYFRQLLKLDNKRIHFTSNIPPYNYSGDVDDVIKYISFFDDTGDDSVKKIKINIHKITKIDSIDESTLENLFEYLLRKLGDNNQVIVSLFSKNMTDVIPKNIGQQFQVPNIIKSKYIDEYTYVLLDLNFFVDDDTRQFYELLDCKESKITEIKIDKNKIKKYELCNIDFKHSEDEKKNKYFQYFVDNVMIHFDNKIVTFYVVKCDISDSMLKMLKRYKTNFDIFNFGTERYLF